EALEEGEGVGRGAREAGEDAVLVEAADLPGGRLHDDVPEGDLAVAAHGDPLAAANGEDGRAVELRGIGAHGGAIAVRKANLAAKNPFSSPGFQLDFRRTRMA